MPGEPLTKDETDAPFKSYGGGTMAESLVAALADLMTLESTKNATIKTKQGGEYSYKYADIADLVKTTRPVLAEHGIAALTPVHALALSDKLACTVILVHKAGETWRFEPLTFEPGTTAQETGSVITYMRRYALLSALGMATEDDDGGKAASTKGEKPRGQRKCVVCDKPLSGPAVPGGGGFAHPECVTPADKPEEEPF